MYDQLMGMNIQQPFPILFAFYALAIPVYICLVTFLMFFTGVILFVCFGRKFFFFVSGMTANIYTCGIDIVLFQIYIQQWSSAAVAIK